MSDIPKEDELYLLRQGVDSPFWKHIHGKWSDFLDKAMAQLLNPKYENRDFLAGKVRGMKDLLSYPERRIETLTKPPKPEE